MTKHVSGLVLDMAALTALMRQAMDDLHEIPGSASGTVNAPFQDRVLRLVGEYSKYASPGGMKYVYMAGERVSEANRFLSRLDVPPQFVGMPPGSMALGSHTLIELTKEAKLIELDSLNRGTFPALEIPLSSATFGHPRGGTIARPGSYIVKLPLPAKGGELWLCQVENIPGKSEDLFDEAWRLGVSGSVRGVSSVPYSSLQIPRFDATVFGAVEGLAGLQIGVNRAGHVKRVAQVVQLATLRIRTGASRYALRDTDRPFRFNGPMIAFTTLPAGSGRIVGTVIAIPNPAAMSL